MSKHNNYAVLITKTLTIVAVLATVYIGYRTVQKVSDSGKNTAQVITEEPTRETSVFEALPTEGSMAVTE